MQQEAMGDLARHTVYVRTVPSTITFSLNVVADDRILDIKQQLEQLTSCPAREMRVVFGSRELRDNRSVSDYGIVPHATMYLLFNVSKSSTPLANKRFCFWGYDTPHTDPLFESDEDKTSDMGTDSDDSL